MVDKAKANEIAEEVLKLRTQLVYLNRLSKYLIMRGTLYSVAVSITTYKSD